MKVYNYLKYSKIKGLINRIDVVLANDSPIFEGLNQKIESIKSFEKYVKFYGFENPLDFYNQPFSFNLINNYFDGWRFTKDSISSSYKNDKLDIMIELYKYKEGYYTICSNLSNDSEIYKVCFPFPDTLNRFISNCEQCGIELKLRR